MAFIPTADTWTGIGLMSGTSLDAVDACAVCIQPTGKYPLGSPGSVAVTVLATQSLPFPSELTQRLLVIQQGEPVQPNELLMLDRELAELYVHVVYKLQQACPIFHTKAVQAIGCHGQTVAHYPPVGTLQLGDPSYVACHTGIPVVSHFRQADMAVGGQGAPLVPFVDALLFSAPEETRCLVNVGGIANITLLPSALAQVTEPVSQLPIQAFDVGPGNMLMDAAAEYFYHHPYDPDGQWAAQGKPNPELLEQMATMDAFLHCPAPKSAGREQYGQSFFQQCLALAPSLSANDWLATLTDYTAYCLKTALSSHSLDRLWISGGGAQNPTLRRAIQRHFSNANGLVVESFPKEMIDPQYKEAYCFAVLAWAYQHHLPANMPSVTGAKRPCVLGRLSLGA